jgi:ATP/maltotriose-dependent transcriptional regulator MalT
MMGDEADRAVEVGSQALEMAEALGLDELRASALNTLGVCRVMTGDLDGLKDLERAIEISREIRSFQLTRALNNMASTLLALGEIERAHVFHTEAAEVAKHVGWKAAVLWLEAEELDWSYYRGQWDDALARADAILEARDSDSRHVPRELDARVIRALLRLARDDILGADEDSAAALSYTDRFSDPQILFPALATRARVLFDRGAKEEAETLLVELLDRWRSNPFTPASDWLAYCAPVIAALGRGPEVAAVAKAAPAQTRWLEASIALFEGNAMETARIYAQIGAEPEEAHARLLAAETLLHAGRRDEAETELARALDFYRRVSATRMIREAEALLAPT